MNKDTFASGDGPPPPLPSQASAPPPPDYWTSEVEAAANNFAQCQVTQPVASGAMPMPPQIGFLPQPSSSSSAMGGPPAYSLEPQGPPLPPQLFEYSLEPSEPPPPYEECVVDCPHSEEDVRTALLEYYKDDCCTSTEPIRDMRIREITPMHAFRYLLETFVESRSLESKSEPYTNQIIDGYQNGPVPDKWSVVVRPPPPFTDSKMSLDLPHSSSVMECPGCHSTGYTTCGSCNGVGFSRCSWCSGIGKRRTGIDNDLEDCSSCRSMGRTSCSRCTLGRIQCKKCRGHRSLRFWKILKIKWSTENCVFETERGELRPQQLRKARCGEFLAEKVTSRRNPQPLNSRTEPKVLKAAKRLISQQLASQNENRKVLKFKQRLGIIPVCKVIYDHDGEDRHFFIFGRTRLIYFPQGYPGRGCCSCCSIV